MAKWKKSLESMIGKKGVETLSKAIHRRDSDSTIGPLDVYLPLLVVPRTILSWLVQNIKPLPTGELETLKFPGMEDIEIQIEKQGADSYRGEFIRGGKVIHSFDKQTLPNVGGNLMSVGEVYESFCDYKSGAALHGDEEITVEGLTQRVDLLEHVMSPDIASPDIASPDIASPDIASPDIAMPRAMMTMMAPSMDSSKIKEMDATTMANLTASLGKLIDVLVSSHLTEKRVEKAISSIKSDLLKDDEYVEMKPSKDEKTSKQSTAGKVRDYNELEVRTISGEKNKTPMKKMGTQEAPSGQAAPKRPDGINEPIKQSRKQVSNSSYFRQILNRTKGIEKKESDHQVHYISEENLYTKCIHCGVPEFKKTEAGPKYKPCACFVVTLKNEDGTNRSFVRVFKKNEGGYSLVFNKDEDKETIRTFLLTLRDRLVKYKDSLS